MESEVLQLGARVCSGDHAGTVRYYGSVEGAKGSYYGVEWDDVSRGKHSGSLKGHTYFITRDGAESGSFVKPKLLKPRLVCREAVEEKYGRIEDEDMGIDESEAFVPATGNTGRVVNIEVIGMKQVNDLQCKFDQLEVVDLSGTCLYGESDPEQLGNLLASCKELSLSRTLVNSWESVSDIIRELSKLQTLHLAGNRLSSPNITDELIDSFRFVTRLNISSCQLSWTKILECSRLWLHLVELYVCLNHIDSVSYCPEFTQLRVLDLTGNPLKSWANLQPFSQLPCLEEMVVMNCSIGDVQMNSVEDFPALSRLTISHNNLDKWTYVNELGKLRKLTDLVFLSNPVLEELDVESNRQLIIAKIPSLTRLNRTTLGGRERLEAEIDYLKRFGAQWFDCGATVEVTDSNRDFYQQHPVYQPLLAKWGIPEKSEVKPEKMVTIKSSLTKLKFVDCTKTTGTTIERNVPLSMTVMKTRSMAAKLHRIRGVDITISYRAAENGVEYKLDNDMRTLDFYAVSDGDEILLKISNTIRRKFKSKQLT